ncbi:MAG: hypothetical protein GYB68_04590, partial [Chloroflexi bacterium]|nr:hypothetical protein [Chloroflexota bacterium]
CNPLTYDVYFGADDNPTYAGSVINSPELRPAELNEQQTYYWRVEVLDRQGDRSSGPLWRFTTGVDDAQSVFPDAPPTWLERLRQNWLVALSLMIGLAVAVAAALVTQRQKPLPHDLSRPRNASQPDDVPDWYSNQDVD